jgi:transaldolase
MPSVSKKQHDFMAAIAKNPSFAKKVGVKQSVGKDFLTADKGKTFKQGGIMKHSDMKQDMPMMKKVAKQEVKTHEKAMHGMKKGGMAYAKGGVTRADGCVMKGHTKGKMVKMKSGGAC